MSETPPAQALSLEFDAPELSVDRFSDLVRSFKGVVDEVSTTGTPQGVRVTWVVSKISKASPFTITVTPKARVGLLSVETHSVQELPRLVINGVNQLMHEARRPTSFSDGALEQLRNLSKLAIGNRGKLRFKSNGTTVEVTGQVAVNVDKILAPAHKSVGTIEGHLDIVNVHDAPYFVVYDDLTHERVTCRLGPLVSVRDVASAIGQRVAIQGEITYRDNGSIVSILAEGLEVMPRDDELPTISDVLGIYRSE